MLNDRLSIAVVGAGAVGAYYGGRLARRGHDLHFLLRSDYPHVARHGWAVKSRDGDFTLPPGSFHAYDDAWKMPKVDLVVVALKATGNDQYEPLIRPLLRDDTLILTLQNGLGNEDQLARLFGPDRILGGLCFVCINRTGPGEIRHTDHGFIRMGDYQEGRTTHVDRVAKLFRDSRIQADALPSLKYARWEKLVWNVPFNGLGAVLDKTTDQLIDNPPGLHLVRSLMAEVIAGAKSHGADLPQDLIEQKIEQTRTMGAYRSSMQVDRQAGRPIEVEAILGEPLRAAERMGVQLPYLRTLYHMAKLVDPGRIAGQDQTP